MGKVIVALTLAGAFTLTGCNYVDPCAQLPAPTKEQLTTAADVTIEVEREGRGGVDCELRDGRWQREIDD